MSKGGKIKAIATFIMKRAVLTPNSKKKLRALSAEPLTMSLNSSAAEKVDFLPVKLRFCAVAS